MSFLSTLDIHLPHEDHEVRFLFLVGIAWHFSLLLRPQVGLERSKVEMFDDSHLEMSTSTSDRHDNTTTNYSPYLMTSPVIMITTVEFDRKGQRPTPARKRLKLDYYSKYVSYATSRGSTIYPVASRPGTEYGVRSTSRVRVPTLTNLALESNAVFSLESPVHRPLVSLRPSIMLIICTARAKENPTS